MTIFPVDVCSVEFAMPDETLILFSVDIISIELVRSISEMPVSLLIPDAISNDVVVLTEKLDNITIRLTTWVMMTICGF